MVTPDLARISGGSPCRLRSAGTSAFLSPCLPSGITPGALDSIQQVEDQAQIGGHLQQLGDFGATGRIVKPPFHLAEFFQQNFVEAAQAARILGGQEVALKESFCKVDGLELGSGKTKGVEQPAFLAGVGGPIQTMAVTARRKQPKIGGQGAAVDLQRLFQLVEAAEENVAHRISARVGSAADNGMEPVWIASAGKEPMRPLVQALNLGRLSSDGVSPGF